MFKFQADVFYGQKMISEPAIENTNAKDVPARVPDDQNPHLHVNFNQATNEEPQATMQLMVVTRELCLAQAYSYFVKFTSSCEEHIRQFGTISCARKDVIWSELTKMFAF